MARKLKKYPRMKTIKNKIQTFQIVIFLFWALLGSATISASMALDCTFRVESATHSGLNIPVDFPQGTRVKAVKFNSKHVENDEPTQYNKIFRQLADQIFEKIKGRKIKNVVYAASGADVVLPHILFPDAELIVTIDTWNTFPKTILDEHNLDKEKLFSKDDGLDFGAETGFIPGGNMVGAQLWGEYLGPTILTSLVKRVPHFHLRTVFLISDPTPKVIRGYGGKIFSTEPNERVHLLIEYDTGPGTTPKRHLHLSTNLGEDPRDFSGFNPEVLIDKGNGGGSSDENFNRAMALAVQKNKGAILTDNMQDPYKRYLPEEYKGAIKLRFNRPFGYGEPHIVLLGDTTPIP
jgi:hypothetical protein